jgi:hypothetical protein
MRKITIKVYPYSELSDKSKANAIDNLHDINVDFGWWDGTYDDAKNIYCEISGFDLGRGNSIEFKGTEYAVTIAEKVISEHGEKCDTYNLAKEFLANHSEDATDIDTNDSLKESFIKSLGECYLEILKTEYGYRMSKEAILETVEANEYEFNADGTLYG